MKHFCKFLTALLLLSTIAMAATTDLNKPRKVVTDASINAGESVFWSKDTVYVMDGYVYVEEGAVLTIESGAVIKGLETPTNGKSVLVISRGAKLYAQGTAVEPIIFTTEHDSVALMDTPEAGDRVDYRTDRSLWGGVVLLGRAQLNVSTEKVVEGLPDDPRAYYGGNDDADNSGVLRYVSIRYTGITVEANKELQGLTCGCVGSGTVIEYVESFMSGDDGFEFFGGTFNSKYLAAVFADDDAFDYDQGYRGKGQFWFALQAPDKGDKLGEYDSGDEGAYTATPLAQPMLYNVTYIGGGASSTEGEGIKYKEYGGGEHYNSIFTEMRKECVVVDSGAGETSYNRLGTGIKLENNLWFKSAGVGFDNATFLPQAFMKTYLESNSNWAEDPMLRAVGRLEANSLDPRPAVNSPAMTRALKSYPSDGFFTAVNYMGAFGQENWLSGWTALSHNGVATTNAQPSAIDDLPTRWNGKTSLSANYPNPFNPTTRIQFSLNQAGRVELNVYNMMGQKVKTLVNATKSAGTYTVEFDGAGLPSGVYFYQLTTPETSLNNKMMLLK